jgi:hypothetical protein
MKSVNETLSERNYIFFYFGCPCSLFNSYPLLANVDKTSVT